MFDRFEFDLELTKIKVVLFAVFLDNYILIVYTVF